MAHPRHLAKVKDVEDAISKNILTRADISDDHTTVRVIETIKRNEQAIIRAREEIKNSEKRLTSIRACTINSAYNYILNDYNIEDKEKPEEVEKKVEPVKELRKPSVPEKKAPIPAKKKQQINKSVSESSDGLYNINDLAIKLSYPSDYIKELTEKYDIRSEIKYGEPVYDISVLEVAMKLLPYKDYLVNK
jgi:hypothetical protein